MPHERAADGGSRSRDGIDSGTACLLFGQRTRLAPSPLAFSRLSL
jgi:hypothetical protein